jgi:hypothetical protein
VRTAKDVQSSTADENMELVVHNESRHRIFSSLSVFITTAPKGLDHLNYLTKAINRQMAA